MTWLLFAGLTAFFDSLKVVFGKHSLTTTDIYVTGCLAFLCFPCTVAGPGVFSLAFPLG